MKEFWNKRYKEKQFVYGDEPNTFFSDSLRKLKPGRLLLPAEGEGRNAVFAAKLGWQVNAFDFSESAREKAMRMADENGVDINYIITNLLDFKAPSNSFDSIGLIYVHMPPNLRQYFHSSLYKLLVPGGSIILEAFSKEQINKKSGGPKDRDMLYNISDLKNDFSGFNIELLEESETTLSEGLYHSGAASVIRLIAAKPI